LKSTEYTKFSYNVEFWNNHIHKELEVCVDGSITSLAFMQCIIELGVRKAGMSQNVGPSFLLGKGPSHKVTSEFPPELET
jgi:hypothetical protein